MVIDMKFPSKAANYLQYCRTETVRSLVFTIYCRTGTPNSTQNNVMAQKDKLLWFGLTIERCQHLAKHRNIPLTKAWKTGPTTLPTRTLSTHT